MLLLTMVIFFENLRLALWTKHAYQDNKIDGQMPFTCEAFNGCFLYRTWQGFSCLFFCPRIQFVFWVGFLFSCFAVFAFVFGSATG